MTVDKHLYQESVWQFLFPIKSQEILDKPVR